MNRSVFAQQWMVLLLLFTGIGFAQDKMPYQLFDCNGKKVTYKKWIQSAQRNDVVLFGEHHDNSIVHWLQLAFTKDLAAVKPLVLGAEMIESDNQAALNQYLKDEINQKQLDSSARLWPNHKTDYKPLIDFAKERKIDFIATNIPRRYASMVYKGGFEALEKITEEEKAWIAPLPMLYDATLPGYLKIIEEMGGHGGANMPKAQAVKDATMAHFIIQNLKKGSVFIHYNGTYHSDNYEGIYWYLKQAVPTLKVMTIATVSQENISKLELEHFNKADFILVIDQDVTKTY